MNTFWRATTFHQEGVIYNMKLICSKSNLLHGVNIVSKAVPTRTTMAILECILIDASANEIKLTANDMELGIETKIEGEIAERGVIALDAKIFSEIVRKLPDSDVTIETDASFKTTITCEKAKFNIVGKSGDDFSYIPYIERNEPIVMSQFTLKEVIRQTIFSIADNDNNKLMTGELFEIEENDLKVVSLDGHRISIRNIELKNNYSHKKVVVPGKTLQEVCKILPGSAEDEVSIFLTDNHIVFEFENTTVVSRLIEGEYFKIEQMLSSDYETKVKINKRELLDCIDRATLLVKEGDKKPIIMNITDGTMELKINSFIGSMNEDIDIAKEGKDILIGFNPKFFIDALRVIDEEEVTLYMVNPKAPCFIKDDEGTFIYLILPVNFNAAAN
jgi:DNA polymerase-3 subunit beta